MKLLAVVLAAMVMLVAGCATPLQQPIQMSESVLGPSQGRVGVAMTPLPKIDTHLPGAGCLLCIAVASAANSSLITHAQTLPYEDLPQLKDRVALLLRKKGVDAVVLPDIDVHALGDFAGEGPRVARKDFRPLSAKHKVDRLLLIDIVMLGFERQYSAYVPSSDPKGILRGTGYLVNLRDNTYDWYMPVDVVKSADKNWDEAPKFPGLTNAYFQVLEIGKDRFLEPFAR